MNSKEKLYETLSLGIYHRFREEDIQEKRKRKRLVSFLKGRTHYCLRPL